MLRPVDEYAPQIFITPVYFTVPSAGLMNGHLRARRRSPLHLTISKSHWCKLDLTGACAPVRFTGVFGTISLSPTQSN